MNSDEAYISRVLESLFSGLRYTRYRTDAQTGKLNSDDSLNTDVSDGLAPPYIWVRFGEDRAAVPVLSKIRDGAGIPVIVAFDTLINEDVVLEVNLARAIPVYGESATAYNIPTIPAGFFTPTNARDVQPGSLRADTTGGLNTRIVPCWLPGGTWWDGGTIITLVPTATSSKWSFVVVGIDSTGAVVQDLTADRALTYPLIDADGNLTNLGATDIQAVIDADPTVFWVGAALLANGATSIDGSRIYDTRFWRRPQTSITVAGDSGSSQTVSEGDTLTVSGGVGLASAASATDTITLNLDIPSLTADATPDLAADYAITYDASASTHKKVLLNTISGTFGGDAFDVPYTPTTGGDWSSAPSEVGGALDTLAADVAGLSAGSGIPADGWVSAGETWTYASADDPTFTFTISGDVTTKYSAGMRVKLTQTTAKYFIITAVAYSSPNTTITIYGGTDYDLANATISSPYYSPVKAPHGFPLDPAKWTVEYSDSSLRSQASPVANTWYNINTASISVPIGAWHWSYQAGIRAERASAGAVDVASTLSTANNTESDTDMTVRVVNGNENVFETLGAKWKYLTLTSKTTYYLNTRVVSSGITNIYNINSQTKLFIRAVCAYL